MVCRSVLPSICGMGASAHCSDCTASAQLALKKWQVGQVREALGRYRFEGKICWEFSDDYLIGL